MNTIIKVNNDLIEVEGTGLNLIKQIYDKYYPTPLILYGFRINGKIKTL